MNVKMLDRRGLQNYLNDANAWLEQADKHIHQIKADFKRLRQRKSNEGRRPPSEMPQQMKEEVLEAEARYDVILDEIREIEKRLVAYADEDKEKDDERMLYYGPQGFGQLRGGVLVEVDGQIVKPDQKGVLRICDPRSPYDGLEAWRYDEEVVKPWLQNCRDRNRHVRREDLPPHPDAEEEAPVPSKKMKKSASA
jgi:hypothetical protein